jgi:hypothetical protein
MKPKTAPRDARSAFSRHTPYPHSPSSVVSSSSQKLGSYLASTSSTRVVSSGGHDMLSKKIDELDKESDIYIEDVDDSHACCAALQYNYTL